jgi:predicted RNase H-like nuclease
VSWDLLEFALIIAKFVAMKLGYGYTIEEQLSATTIGGIQIDVFPSLVGVAKFHHDRAKRLELALDKSPQDLNIKPKEQITMTST